MPCKEVPVFRARDSTFLASLPTADWNQLRPKLQYVSLPLGGVIYESGVRLRHLYFPTTSIVSLQHVLASGEPTEIAVVGNEGVVGMSLLMADGATPSRAVVRAEGGAYRLEAEILEEEFGAGTAMHTLLLLYAQALITQMAQTVVCNRHHTIDQQLCRWLLLSLDRLTSNKLRLTHEMIANGLGVRREGVTEAANRLQSEGVIRCSRGCITVVDRYSLEARSCECYRVVKKESDRLMPATTASFVFCRTGAPPNRQMTPGRPC